MTESATRHRRKLIALVGNPNSGKTALFNALTGLRLKVGNYPGVTVEKKEGTLQWEEGYEAILLDLPGTYSLHSASPDEHLTTSVIFGQAGEGRSPDAILCVIDASNLERNLYLASQLLDLRIPLVIALNMVDIARENGIEIDLRAMSEELGVPVVPTVANKGTGIDELRTALRTAGSPSQTTRRWDLPEPVDRETRELAGLLTKHHGLPEPVALHEALDLLSAPPDEHPRSRDYSPEIISHVKLDHEKLEFLGYDAQSVFVEERYRWIASVLARTTSRRLSRDARLSDRIDAVVTHRVWGFLLFGVLMGGIFQSIFAWATIPMELIADAFDWLGAGIAGVMPPGDLRSLIVDGGLGGVAAVVTFLPQIAFLFFFLGLLEDTGYMARAAFIMDRVMSRAGLSGKAFIPLLGSFACAIPGIMATRTIENRRDRMVTMLIAPLMSCSARLPVYTLMIAAFIPSTVFFGIFTLPGITLFALYSLGLAAALTLAWFLRKTLFRGESQPFVMELPPYKRPSLRSVLLQVWSSSLMFLKSAGTIILGASIILWFLATYPRLEGASRSEQLTQSFAGQAGRFIEPLIQPLGFDWRVGIGIVASLLQREVFVSTMGTIYSMQDEGGGETSLAEMLRSDVDPDTGKPAFTLLTALCVMVYYVLAMQCMSTLAVLRRETNGWTWPAFQFAVMTALAWVVTFLVHRAGLIIGLGG